MGSDYKTYDEHMSLLCSVSYGVVFGDQSFQ